MSNIANALRNLREKGLRAFQRASPATRNESATDDAFREPAPGESHYLSMVVWYTPAGEYSRNLRFTFEMVDLTNGRIWTVRKSITLSDRYKEIALKKFPHLPENDAIAKLFFSFDRAYRLADGRLIAAADYWSMEYLKDGDTREDTDGTSRLSYSELTGPSFIFTDKTLTRFVDGPSVGCTAVENVEMLSLREQVRDLTARLDESRRLVNAQNGEMKRLADALITVYKWKDFPESGRTFEDGRPMSYLTAFGSNGERDYMRTVAGKAVGFDTTKLPKL